MGENVLLQQRCLALQLIQGTVPSPHLCPASPSSSSNSSSSSGGDTPTPTNSLPVPIHSRTCTSASDHQDGYLLFLAWRAANVACVWDRELVRAVGVVEYLGHLVGGVVLVGGPVAALATLTHAWSRSLLAAPPGYTLSMLGEVRGMGVVKVPQGQFTPLSDALCWVVHHLTREGGQADPGAVQAALTTAFPTLTSPDPAHIHTTLSNLIHQCKVYYSGSSYGIVHPDTYQPLHTAPHGPNPGLAAQNSDGDPVPAPDGSAHAVAQTDLAELITGVAQPSDTIITPTLPGGGKEGEEWWSPEGGGRPHTARTASLRLSPTRAALLASALSTTSTSTTNTYCATDSSDVTIRAERGSVLSKLLLLRVPGRRRLATCSAQFPPPEWSDTTCSTRHLHSVSTQTATLTHVPSTSWLCQQWTPRSATLPRRLRPPRSSTPPPRPPQSATPPPNSRRSLDQLPSAARNFSRPQASIHNKHLSPSHHKIDTHKSNTHRNDIQRNNTHKVDTHKNDSHKFDAHKSQSQNNHTPGRCGSPHYHNVEYHRSYSETSAARELLSKERLKEATEGERKEERRKEDRQQQHHTNKHSRKQQQEKTDDIKIVEYQEQAVHRKQNKARNHVCDKQLKNNKSPSTVHTEKSRQSVSQRENKLSKNLEANMNVESDEAVVSKCEGVGDGQERRYDRSTLQLPLVSGIGVKVGKEPELEEGTGQHMNNCRKVARSPQQRPHDLTTNLLHITKGSVSDLTSRNLGYQEVDKCHKKSCSQTLDQALLKQPPDTSPDTNVEVIMAKEVGEGKNSQGEVWHGGVKIGGEGAVSPDKVSVSTYPSLSDLNLTFTSLAAQKILAGGSINSLDTLAEVNLAAKKRNKTPVTNTDFGFL